MSLNDPSGSQEQFWHYTCKGVENWACSWAFYTPSPTIDLILFILDNTILVVVIHSFKEPNETTLFSILLSTWASQWLGYTPKIVFVHPENSVLQLSFKTSCCQLEPSPRQEQAGSLLCPKMLGAGKTLGAQVAKLLILWHLISRCSLHSWHPLSSVSQWFAWLKKVPSGELPCDKGNFQWRVLWWAMIKGKDVQYHLLSPDTYQRVIIPTVRGTWRLSKISPDFIFLCPFHSQNKEHLSDPNTLMFYFEFTFLICHAGIFSCDSGPYNLLQCNKSNNKEGCF